MINNNNNNNNNGKRMRWEGGCQPKMAGRRRLVGVLAATVRGLVFEKQIIIIIIIIIKKIRKKMENERKNNGKEMKGCSADEV